MAESLEEAKRALEQLLDEDGRRQYFYWLSNLFQFNTQLTPEDFVKKVEKFLVTPEHIHCHNNFFFLMIKRAQNHRLKATRTMNEKDSFEWVDYSMYLNPSSPTKPYDDLKYRSAANELFVPDSGFISNRIAIAAWENGMDGADDDVTELVTHACQVFIKNIITAMVSRKKSYKIRDRKFQYGFNQAIPDPFLRNYNKVEEDMQESKMEVADNDDSFMPKCKISLEKAEQQSIFTYACSKQKKNVDNVLTVRLLYDTLKENPKILGLHTISYVALLKLGLHLDE